ncbi:hypothetical protein ACFLYO_11005 [Chloroflexota bacterium]
MYTLGITQSDVLLEALDTAMRNQFGDRISGLSTNGTTLRIHFFEPYTPTDETAAQGVIDAHDPVFITAERDGDNMTITLTKPHNVDGATALTLTIDDVAAPDSTALVNNVATAQIESADEITIGILEDYPHQEVTI